MRDVRQEIGRVDTKYLSAVLLLAVTLKTSCLIYQLLQPPTFIACIVAITERKTILKDFCNVPSQHKQWIMLTSTLARNNFISSFFFNSALLSHIQVKPINIEWWIIDWRWLGLYISNININLLLLPLFCLSRLINQNTALEKLMEARWFVYHVNVIKKVFRINLMPELLLYFW